MDRVGEHRVGGISMTGRAPPAIIVVVKHASAEALNALAPLLVQLRLLPELTEKKPGVFYRKSRAFLHFHEDPAGLFADVRLAAEFERFEVTTSSQRASFL